ncbi:hypothetical protein BX666DRAFT_2139681 [Dichotomocladium elegans]|nr:hypothetical protein BX666DRAFT_2139681 [Dichotomocladium elegans]
MTFTFVGGHDKKIPLEQQYHPCPRCNQASVQLTRSESHLILFNRHIGKTSNMRVRYECSRCGWKNEQLPDNPNNSLTDSSNKQPWETEDSHSY